MSLVEELIKEEATEFQVNKFDKDSIDKTLSDKTKGIFNLLYKIIRETRTKIIDYIQDSYPNYESELKLTGAHYQIGFRKKGE
jgi:hypothetical protein